MIGIGGAFRSKNVCYKYYQITKKQNNSDIHYLPKKRTRRIYYTISPIRSLHVDIICILIPLLPTETKNNPFWLPICLERQSRLTSSIISNNVCKVCWGKCRLFQNIHCSFMTKETKQKKILHIKL